MHCQFCGRENTMACSLRVASYGHSIVYVDKDLYTTERQRTRHALYVCRPVPYRGGKEVGGCVGVGNVGDM